MSFTYYHFLVLWLCLVDNKSRKPIDREPMDLSYFQNLNSDASEETRLSSQLLLAVFQFLTAGEF